jgi:putative spermidine/putrescine transport system ATP-binding protein
MSAEASAKSEAPFVELDELRLMYPGARTNAVDGVSVSVRRGEVVTLLGPSGCGKTSALRLVAGLETPDAGLIRVDGRDVTSWPPERRRMGFVFQNYALFPHLTVGENVAFGLRVRKVAKDEEARTVAESLALVDLAGFEARRVDQLSGGQQQRVALARALAIKPDVLLLDEPLSNLDASLREQTREALRAVLRKLGITTFFVTHDQSEAFAFSDTVVLMRAGRVVETGPPERLYREPETVFAAEFLGGANVIAGRSEGDGLRVRLGGENGPTIEAASWSPAAAGAPAGAGVSVVIRPEQVRIANEPGPNRLEGRVLDRVFLGATSRTTIEVASAGATLRCSGNESVEGPLWVELRPDAVRVIRETE